VFAVALIWSKTSNASSSDDPEIDPRPASWLEVNCRIETNEAAERDQEIAAHGLPHQIQNAIYLAQRAGRDDIADDLLAIYIKTRR